MHFFLLTHKFIYSQISTILRSNETAYVYVNLLELLYDEVLKTWRNIWIMLCYFQVLLRHSLFFFNTFKYYINLFFLLLVPVLLLQTNKFFFSAYLSRKKRWGEEANNKVIYTIWIVRKEKKIIFIDNNFTQVGNK